MAPQHVEVAETVAALRRKLRRENQILDTTAQSSQIATNRGNKLRPGARFVHTGALHGSNAYKEKITHAGYERYILARNPSRYNGYGDELEDSESDPDADEDAEGENAYGNVHIEEILKPLTHPHELISHPGLAPAYLDNALPEMVTSTEERIRAERNNLWRAKSLYRYFTRDESWIPCERVESEQDWDLFRPRPKRRRLNPQNGTLEREVEIADATIESMNGVLDSMQDELENGMSLKQMNGNDPDVTMMGTDDVQTQPQKNGTSGNMSAEAAELPHVKDEENHQPTTEAPHVLISDTVNGYAMSGANPDVGNSELNLNDVDIDMKAVSGRPARTNPPPLPSSQRTTHVPAQAEAEVEEGGADDDNPQTPSSVATTPTMSSFNQEDDAYRLKWDYHPMFLLPTQLHASHLPHLSYPPLSTQLAHSGLPPEEILETRKLLSMYVQKSEETIRGLEGIYGKLVKAKRRREKVWSWCVAEGHVGELSDGEDWIDCEAWGLERGELRKGRDEDAANLTVEGAVNLDGEVETTTNVVMGGRKGKRRGRAAAKE